MTDTTTMTATTAGATCTAATAAAAAAAMITATFRDIDQKNWGFLKCDKVSSKCRVV